MSFDVSVEATLGDTVVICRIEPVEGLTALLGPSGAGKTSTLNMISGLLRPDRGHVRVSGETLFDSTREIDLPPERRHAGYVFQDARLFPHMTVRANLLYGAGAGAEISDRLDFLGIGRLLDRWPRSLSGGEARRVAIGRALLSSSRFLLLDEPLASLDRARREEVMWAIEHVRDALRLPVLLVTHDRAEAERLADAVIEM